MLRLTRVACRADVCRRPRITRDERVDFARPLRARCFDEQHAALELHRGGALERRADGGVPREVDLAVRERRAAQQFARARRA